MESAESQEQTRLPTLLPRQTFYKLASTVQKGVLKGGGAVVLGLKEECEKGPGSLGT